MAENIGVDEYTLLESVHIFAGFLDTFALPYPQMQDVDLRTQAPDLDVPCSPPRRTRGPGPGGTGARHGGGPDDPVVQARDAIDSRAGRGRDA